jgi:hypothetical protein
VGEKELHRLQRKLEKWNDVSKKLVWELRDIRSLYGKGICPLCLEDDGAKVVSLEEVERREEFECSKWLNMNEDLACKKVLNRTNVTKLKTIGKYLSKMRCKWENKVCKTRPLLEA